MSIAIVDAVSASRRGLSTALTEAGFAVEETADLLQWAARKSNGSGAVIHVRGDADLACVAAASARNGSLAIVLMESSSNVRTMQRALAAGATASVDETAPLDDVVRVVQLAVRGHSVVPRDALSGLIRDVGIPPEDCPVTTREAEWIARLASGTTVTELAQEVGYSEREVYRHLSDIYRRMGARNRTEALVRATRWGLVS